MRLTAGFLLSALPYFMAGDLFADDGKSVPSPADIKLVRVKASEIENIIAGHKGKVVVVDVWAEF